MKLNSRGKLIFSALIVFTWFGISWVYGYFSHTEVIVRCEYVMAEKTIKTGSVLVRDSRIVLSPVAGYIRYIVPPGNKVKEGTLILEVLNKEISSALEEENSRLNSEIREFVIERDIVITELTEQLNHVKFMKEQGTGDEYKLNTDIQRIGSELENALEYYAKIEES